VSRRLRGAAGLAAAALLVAACGDQPAAPPAGEKSAVPAPAAKTPSPAENPPREPAAAASASAPAVPVATGKAEKGKQVWLGQCVACHHPDPTKDGPLGPAVKGASLALLEARVVRGEYPPGYKPKRPTKVMPPRPDLAPSISELAAYLR
jgi:mono/diheme cytochrome c family protein